MPNLDVILTAPSLRMQHLKWLLSQPGLYIALVIYVSVLGIWVYAFRRVVVKKTGRPFQKFLLVFYSIFIVLWVIFTLGKYKYYKGML